MNLSEITTLFLQTKNIDTINKIYSDWANNNDKELYALDRFFKLDSSSAVGLPVWLSEYFEINKNVTPECLGVDIPYFLDNGKKETIAIFGLNPLRNHGDWADAKNEAGNAAAFPYSPDNSFILNSAWGAHCGFVQNQNKQLFQTLSQHYNLYLSDYQKWFFKQGKTPSQNIRSFVDLPQHADVLDKELRIVSPKYILTLGNEVKDVFGLKTPALTKNKIRTFEKNGQVFIPIPHTSNGVYENLKRSYAAANGFEHNNKTLGADYANNILNMLNQR